MHGMRKVSAQQNPRVTPRLQRVCSRDTSGRWWAEYSDRKNDEEDEHVSDSLLYDRSHLPRTAPPPECVHEARALQRQLDMPQPAVPGKPDAV